MKVNKNEAHNILPWPRADFNEFRTEFDGLFWRNISLQNYKESSIKIRSFQWSTSTRKYYTHVNLKWRIIDFFETIFPNRGSNGTPKEAEYPESQHHTSCRSLSIRIARSSSQSHWINIIFLCNFLNSKRTNDMNTGRLEKNFRTLVTQWDRTNSCLNSKLLSLERG